MTDGIDVEQLTPMMRQYFEIKKNYPDTLVFYRLGDFYELFYDDAKIVSNLLDLTLTRRGNQGGQAVPMAGVPYHSSETYISRLIKMGRSVVICEQVGDKTKGAMMTRKVSRIITPGTVTDEGLIPERQDNLIACIYEHKDTFALATLNMSTGRFAATQVGSMAALAMLLSKTNPAELLYPERFQYYKDIQSIICRKALPLWDFNYESAYARLCEQFKVKSLNSFGIADLKCAISAAGALLSYVKSTQNVDLEHVTNIINDNISNVVMLDFNAQKNLELIESLSGNEKSSLLGVLDETQTPMGTRLLRNMIINPLRNNSQINSRLDLVEALYHSPKSDDLANVLNAMGDLERIVARIGLRSAKPRDLSKLRDAIELLPAFKALLTFQDITIASPANASDSASASASASANASDSESDASDAPSDQDSKIKDKQGINLLAYQCELLPELDEEGELLKKAICEFPALLIREGGVIAEGYHEELDELRDLQNGSENTLIDIENREKERTGISSLKVRFNNVHGYYIELSRNAADQVPAEYVRRQTLKNSERYITPELKVLEEKTLSAKARSLQLEKELFDEVIEKLILSLPKLSSFAHNIALLDVALSLSQVAKKHHYVRPQLSSDNIIKIESGRHPVVEAINDKPFIVNSIELNDKQCLAVISGPNMGGKSTFMRQTALIAIMARMGSFVPATSAIIGDIDRIFTRIGASDDLASGRSTFMVEMEETATILNNATANSLVIMDEVGRGTSGAEGAAIAEAIVQYLSKNICPKTMFATHYTEVTTLVENYSNAFNLCFNAKEFQGKIVFLYSAQKGRQSRSFGIEVAQLAGVPSKITKSAIGFYQARTKELASGHIFTSPLINFEQDTNLEQNNEEVASNNNELKSALDNISALEAQLLESQAHSAQLEYELKQNNDLKEHIAKIDLNSLTPLEALNALNELKKMISSKD